MSQAAIATKFPAGRRRSAVAKTRLASAYRAVFTGNGTREDAEIVLSDLANCTGFFKTLPKDASSDLLRYCEGKRSVYGHIFGFLTMTPEQLRALQQAARQEAITDGQEADWSDI